MHLVERENSKDRLSLELSSKSWFTILFGAAFVAGGILAIWMLSYSVSVAVKDNHLRYELKLLGLFMTDRVAVPRNEVNSVSIVLVEGVGRSYEVAIDTAVRKFHVWLPHADGDMKRRIAGDLRQALAAPGQTYRYSDNGTTLGLLIGLLPILGGLFMLASLQQVTIVGNRQDNELNIDRRLLLLPKWSRRVLPLSEVSDIEKREFSWWSRGQKVTTFNVIVVAKSGVEMSVAFGPIFASADADTLVERLRRWLA